MIIYNKERHKELVIRSLDLLNNQGTTLYFENFKEDLELNDYDILVEEEVFRLHEEEFVQIIRNFVTNNLNFDEFETAFSLLYNEVRKEVNLFRLDLEKIDKFQLRTRL